ncbi:MAG: hypothetical protein AB8I08_02230 [Sandaracinaceae bacterium]
MTMKKIGLAAVALCVWLAPQSQAYAQAETTLSLSVSEPPLEDADGGSEPTWWLVGIGGGVFVADYLLEIVVTAATGGTAEDIERVAIPLAGPWLELAEGGQEWWEVGLGIYEGVIQIAALTAMVVGLAWQQPTGGDEPPEASVTITPTALPGGGGLAALGTFR